MPRESVKELFNKFPVFSSEVIEDAFSRLRGAHNVSRALAHDSVEIRVATALLALTPEIAIDSSDFEEEIIMTRQELADSVGSTLETAVRVTKNMERDGLIDVSQRGKIRVLKRDSLVGLVETAV